jgi:tripartite-type tricarboxylate transporter receptor subunit TctC
LLSKQAGIEFGKTQYRGSSAIVTDLLGGHIDVGMDSVAGYVPTVREGKIKALAIASAQRWSQLPNVPTVAESGLPGFEASVWYAILVPTKAPDEVVSKINAIANAWLKEPKTQEFMANLGAVPAGGTPADLRAFTQSEMDKWGPIVKGANISF